MLSAHNYWTQGNRSVSEDRYYWQIDPNRFESPEDHY